jgi:hypothetical protein
MFHGGSWITKPHQSLPSGDGLSPEKMVPKMGKSKVGWNIPPHEGFKGKII